MLSQQPHRHLLHPAQEENEKQLPLDKVHVDSREGMRPAWASVSLRLSPEPRMWSPNSPPKWPPAALGLLKGLVQPRSLGLPC